MNRRGFTLIELLVVVAIMIVLFTIAVPSVRSLLNSGRVNEGVAGVGTAVASVRVFANASPAFNIGTYEGVAVIFTPSNELRMAKHDPYARNGTSLLQDPPAATLIRAGYSDVDREYSTLPTGVGVMGITKSTSTGETILIPPPFAIRFNPNGHMIASTLDQDPSAAPTLDPHGTISYDGDQDGNYEDQSRWNGGAWEFTEYDPESPDYDEAKAFDAASQRYKFNWEEMDAVIGVIVYEKAALLEAGETLNKGTGAWLNDSARDWLLDNGEVVFFNRYNGSRLRSR